MGFIPFIGQKKDKPEENPKNEVTQPSSNQNTTDEKGLNELKRLTMGQDGSLNQQPNQENPKQSSFIPQQNPANLKINKQNKKNEILTEEQKIFTQINSVKELTKGEASYEVPKELTAPKANREIPAPKEKILPKESIKKEYQKAEENTTEDTNSSESAFSKLLKLSSSKIEEDKTKSTISTSEFYKKTITPQKETSTTFDGDAKKIVVQGEETKPVIQKEIPQTSNETEQKTNEESQKEVVFDWMKEDIVDEPSPEDFPTEEGPNFFAKEKNALEEEQKKTEDTFSAMRTPIDDMFELLEKYRKIDIGEVATYLKVTTETVDRLSKMFEEDGILEIEYPTSLTKKPLLILKNEVISKLNRPPVGEVLQSYQVEVDYVPAKISIVITPNEARPIYGIEMPSIGKYTKRFLSYIKDEVAETMPIELEEIVDPKKSKKLKERFFFELNAHLAKYFPSASKELLSMLSGVLLHEMYGLGDIELIMGDDMLEEVGINSAKTPITVYHRVHGWLKTNLMPGSEDEINNFSSQIGRKVGREITTLSPILDAHLLSGDRVNATLFPISAEGNTITIRRFARRPWTLVDFIGKAHTMDAEMAAMLWLAMQYEMNIIIAGGTASGKTSTLNTLLALVPTYHRIISIEDVREIILPSYLDWNWVPMVTRSPNPEGLGEVTMLDLMVTSLRMRPDRIIVGEIRRKKEAEVLMEAIETGHSIYSTIHANSGYQVLRRLAEAPIAIPLMQIELIDLIVVQYRDRKTNKRRTYEIAEVEQTSTGQGLQVNTIYKWVPRTDNWEKLNKPTKLITLLNVHTGLTEEDIYKEIKERAEILEWMKRNTLNDLDQIGFIMKLFYSNATRVKKMAKDNTPAEEILKLMNQQDEDSIDRGLAA